MGFEVAVGALALVSAGAEVGKAISQNDAAASKTRALDLEANQIKLQTQQKTLNNYAVMEKVLASQEAAQTIRGTSFSSPSFNAIQRDTLNIGAKRQKNINIEGSLAEENIDIEKQNVKDRLISDMFSDITETAGKAFNMISSYPTLEKAYKGNPK